ncbi:MAG: hypothetical protein KAS32_13465 [Candidatus Peribacteraceae bacterium]|nr:hypothetical protein [Candidatus Peribacteraceae bacterium]
MEQCGYCGCYVPSGCGEHYCAEELQEDVSLFMDRFSKIFPKVAIRELSFDEIDQMVDEKSNAAICVHCKVQLTVRGGYQYCPNCNDWIPF